MLAVLGNTFTQVCYKERKIISVNTGMPAVVIGLWKLERFIPAVAIWVERFR